MLPTPGSPDFTPALIEAIESEPSLLGWEVDGTLVAVILVALVVGRGGVIIDVPSGRKMMSAIRRATRTAIGVSGVIAGMARSERALDALLLLGTAIVTRARCFFMARVNKSDNVELTCRSPKASLDSQPMCSALTPRAPHLRST
jgi:hypothetical protein